MQTKIPNDRKMTYKPSERKDYALPGKKYWIVFFTTLMLIIAMTISLFAVLVIEDGNTNGIAISGGNSGSGNGKNPIVNNNTSIGVKTGITLPCSTPNGNYLSSSASNVNTIDGIASDCAILVDINGNISVAEKNADAIIYPASMTKVMTLLVACERATNPDVKLTITQEMVDYQQITGGSGNLAFAVGEQITVEDALYLINYRSDTIACLLIAEYVAGGEQGFVDLMNQKAREIGLSKTNFTNCTGLHNENHYTTCREMAAIMRCAVNNETAKQIITAYSGYSVDIYLDGALERNPTVYSGWYSERMGDNAWVGNASDVKVLGGKTGYEDIPKACFVTYAQNTKSGKYYVCVTVGRQSEGGANLGSSQSTTDTKTVYKTYAK